MHLQDRCCSKMMILRRLAAVHLVDAHLTSDPGKYLAAALLSLSTMLHLGLPHINVLSKVQIYPSADFPPQLTCNLVTPWQQCMPSEHHAAPALRMISLAARAVHLVLHCVTLRTEASTFQSVVRLCARPSAACLWRMQVDLVAQYGRPAFGLEYYTAAEDLGQLADLMAGESAAGSSSTNEPGGERQSATATSFPPRFRRLTSALCEASRMSWCLKPYSTL